MIGVGASFGILTSLLVAMLGQARYMCVIGRSNVVPSWFAKVHPNTSTPVNASAFLGTLLLLFSSPPFFITTNYHLLFRIIIIIIIMMMFYCLCSLLI